MIDKDKQGARNGSMQQGSGRGPNPTMTRRTPPPEPKKEPKK